MEEFTLERKYKRGENKLNQFRSMIPNPDHLNHQKVVFLKQVIDSYDYNIKIILNCHERDKRKESYLELIDWAYRLVIWLEGINLDDDLDNIKRSFEIIN